MDHVQRVLVFALGDYDSTADIEVLARGIEEGVAELVKAAEQHHQRGA